jgi:hypothetical protein
MTRKYVARASGKVKSAKKRKPEITQELKPCIPDFTHVYEVAERGDGAIMAYVLCRRHGWEWHEIDNSYL